MVWIIGLLASGDPNYNQPVLVIKETASIWSNNGIQIWVSFLCFHGKVSLTWTLLLFLSCWVDTGRISLASIFPLVIFGHLKEMTTKQVYEENEEIHHLVYCDNKKNWWDDGDEKDEEMQVRRSNPNTSQFRVNTNIPKMILIFSNTLSVFFVLFTDSSIAAVLASVMCWGIISPMRSGPGNSGLNGSRLRKRASQ